MTKVKRKRIEPALKTDGEVWLTLEDSEAHMKSIGTSKSHEKKETPINPTLENCKICNGLVATMALTCPHCGDTFRSGLQGLEKLMEKRHPRLYKTLILGAVAVLTVTTLGFFVTAYLKVERYSKIMKILN